MKKVVLVNLVVEVECPDHESHEETSERLNETVCSDAFLEAVLDHNEERQTCSCDEIAYSVICNRDEVNELPRPQPMGELPPGAGSIIH